MPAHPSWLDSVLAVPAIGLLTQPRIAFPSVIWPVIERASAQWDKDGLGEAKIKVNNPTSIQVTRAGGLYISLSPAELVIGHTFNVEVQNRPGRLPEMSEGALKPYSELQADALRVLKDFLQFGFSDQAEYQLVRIGVLAQTRLIESEAPPGIARYIAGVGAATGARLTAMDGSTSAHIADVEGGWDQCHHRCKMNSVDRPDDLEFGLDYQRRWRPTRHFSTKNIRRELDAVIADASEHIEKFGSGEI